MSKLFFTMLGLCIVLVTQADPNENAGYAIGDEVVSFELKNVDNKLISLDDFKSGKGVIVIFTCNHCPYAKMWEDRVIGLNTKYQEQGYPVVAINPNTTYNGDSFEDMVKRAEEKGYDFPYLADNGQVVAKRFGATRTPHVFVLTKVGSKFKVSYIGAIDDNYKSAGEVTKKYVEDAVDALLKSKKPEVASTKSIGCGIKWDE